MGKREPISIAMNTRVMFVCMGNICRSPMAEGVFRHMVAQAAPMLFMRAKRRINAPSWRLKSAVIRSTI